MAPQAAASPTTESSAAASAPASAPIPATAPAAAPLGIGAALAIAVVLGLNLYFSLYTFHALSYRCQADCTATKPVGKTMTAFTGTGDNNLFFGRKLVRFMAGVSVLVSVIAVLVGLVVMGTSVFSKKA